MWDLLEAIEASAYPTFVRESPSLAAYTLVLSLHAMGLAVVVGLSSAIALRLLGVARSIPLAPLQKLFPIMYLGFWVNAASGLALLAANARGMLGNPLFYAKILFIVGGVLVMRLLRNKVFSGQLVNGGPPPSSARNLAWHRLPLGARAHCGATDGVSIFDRVLLRHLLPLRMLLQRPRPSSSCRCSPGSASSISAA
jgi:hypothetical protein